MPNRESENRSVNVSNMVMSEAPFILFSKELGFQKRRPLFHPGDRFHGNHRDFPIGQVIGVDPYIQEQLGDPAEQPGLEIIVGNVVHLLLQLLENVKQKGTVGIRQLFFHDEHIEHMPRCGFQVSVESRQVLGIQSGDNGPGLVQVLFVMGVGVMVAECFYIIVPLFRQDDVRGLQQLFRFFCGEHRLKGGLPFFLSLKMPAIVRQADVVGVQILPAPVQTRQLAVIGIEMGDVVSFVIPLKADGIPAEGAHLHWQVHGVIGDSIGFVCGCDDFDQLFHCLVSLFLGIRVKSKFWRPVTPIINRFSAKNRAVLNRSIKIFGYFIISR